MSLLAYFLEPKISARNSNLPIKRFRLNAGPVVYRPNDSDIFKLIGIVETNYDSSSDVYLNISSFRDWINNPKVSGISIEILLRILLSCHDFFTLIWIYLFSQNEA